MLRVGVLGAAGRMGRQVLQAVDADDELVLAAGVDPGLASGDEVPEVLAHAGAAVCGSVEALDPAALDVLVDFTVAEAARRSLRWCAANRVHAVVGTTGIDHATLAQLGEEFRAQGTGLVVAANFAIGAVLLMRLAELAAPLMDGVEVIELHHDAKRDAPSGTALVTAGRLAEARRRAGGGPWPADPTTNEVLPGSRGAVGPGGVHVHAVRLHGLVAHQEVVFGALGQSLTLRHDSYDRSSFMPGVVLAVKRVGGRPGLTSGLDTLLGF